MKNQKTIIITGACGIIGSGILKGLILEQYNLILVDNNRKKIEELSKKIISKKILFVEANILKKHEIDLCIKKGLDKFGEIDVAIHAVYPKSKGWGTKFENLEEDYLMEDIKNQLGSAIIFSQRIIDCFLNQGYGNLIHISSIQGVSQPKFDHYAGTDMISPIEYSAIKSGIISITKYLSKYYKKRNLRVNCISPGGIANNQPNIFIENYNNSCNSKGLLDSEDLIGLILFLISDKSKYINGQNIIIDDGWSL